MGSSRECKSETGAMGEPRFSEASRCGSRRRTLKCTLRERAVGTSQRPPDTARDKKRRRSATATRSVSPEKLQAELDLAGGGGCGSDDSGGGRRRAGGGGVDDGIGCVEIRVVEEIEKF